MSEFYELLRYYPVLPMSDPKASELIKHFFDNVLYSMPQMDTAKSGQIYRFIDSGGRQILMFLSEGRIIIIDPLMETNTKDQDFAIYGIESQCREYARRKASQLMAIDFPVYTTDDDLTYHWKLYESVEALDLLLDWANYYCPNIPLGIALQQRNPIEVEHYYVEIFTPEVEILAVPIRDFRNKPIHALGNAYILSFLSDVKTNWVHFLGSNAPPIIFLLAQAIALGMFPKCSFDSRTWDQIALSGYRYLNPDTLSSVPTKKEGQLDPNDNLRTVFKPYNGLFDDILGPFDPPEWVLVEDWLGISNIRLIERFKDMVLNIAMNNDLPYFIKQFPKYGKSKEKILEALDMLEESKEYGHDHIEQKYGAKIEELYS